MLNFGIYWASNTQEYTELVKPKINSDDPNEPFETGHRDLYQPFPERIIDEEKYKEMHTKMFADGPKLKFVASDKFVRSLPGYLFYMGPKGLGYYIDHYIMRHVYHR
jgi:hypothetical protein